DSAGDGGAVDIEPASQPVAGDRVQQAYQCDQEPIDEDQAVLCAAADRSAPWPGETRRSVDSLPISAAIAAITPGASPTIRRPPTIASRTPVPTMNP
ncbi:hypothetical protein LO763_26585, partial [Glycomyces sp. A-F 0318]|uniref:hypothetical protein n=1 Tax=Glycomyces amatae TaxID=2881355 RepID=UPI001E582D54